MRKPVIAIYDNTKQDYVSAIPHIYYNNQWVPAGAKTYANASWQDIGGAGELFYNFLESAGKTVIDSTSGYFLIRENPERDRFITSDGKEMKCKDHYVTSDPIPVACFKVAHRDSI